MPKFSSSPTKLMLIPLLMTAVLALTACSGSIVSGNQPIHAPRLTADQSTCKRPALLPERKLSQKEVEAYWATDRSNLIKCGLSLEVLVKHYEGLAEDLSQAGIRSTD